MNQKINSIKKTANFRASLTDGEEYDRMPFSRKHSWEEQQLKET